MLPFKLTDGQRQALAEIVADMQKPWPMQRLLQGDVGAGKTIVALLAALVAMENGFQVAFMAPTEILAEQHFGTLSRWLAATRYRVALLSGRITAAERRTLLPAIERGDVHLVVGTHALVQEQVKFRALALAIIDEQHRFGVLQRATLAAKGLHPDVLVMTATPIPRTLALTECGDMEVSVIRGLPPGRKPVRTLVKPDSRREDVYDLVRQQVQEGRQAYVIYPLVEESEKVDLKAATAMAEHLARDVFPDLTVALLHGRMKGDEKERVMRAFAAGTSEHPGRDDGRRSRRRRAERDGDGRRACRALRPVAAASAARPRRPRHATSRCACCCISRRGPRRRARGSRRWPTPTTASSSPRRDLQLRGPGDFFGTRQHGLPQLRAGDLTRDVELLEMAFSEARKRVDERTLHGGRASVRAERLAAAVRVDHGGVAVQDSVRLRALESS